MPSITNLAFTTAALNCVENKIPDHSKYITTPEFNKLRYYATLKLRKFESLSYKINTCLKKLPLVLDCGQSKYSLWIFNIYIYIYIRSISILVLAFVVPFLCYFLKLQILMIKKFWNDFCCIVFLFLWAQKVHLRFLKSDFKLKILTYLSLMVSFLVDMFN